MKSSMGPFWAVGPMWLHMSQTHEYDANQWVCETIINLSTCEGEKAS